MSASNVNTDFSHTEIVFIDGSLSDIDQLVAAVKPGTEAVVLDAALDGLLQIALVLAGRSGIDAVHVLSHGSAGALELGSAHVTQASLATYGDALGTIRAALAADADLLLYGCDVAQGARGRSFIEALAAATGADVAASTDLTGSALLGGNWELEAMVGHVGTASLGGAGALAAYAGTLGMVPTGTTIDFATEDGSPLGPVVTDGQYNSTDIGGLVIDLYQGDSNGIATGYGLSFSTEYDGVAGNADGSETGGDPTMVIAERDGKEFAFKGIKLADYLNEQHVIQFEGFKDGVSTGTATVTMTGENLVVTESDLPSAKFGDVDKVVFKAISGIAGNGNMWMTYNDIVIDTNGAAPGGDTTAPTVSAIEYVTSTTGVTNADVLVYKVSFSEEVKNVDGTDFTLAGPTGSTIGATSVDGRVYTVTVSGGNLAGYNGAVTLGFSSGHDIADNAGNPLDLSGAPGINQVTYDVDNTAPTVASIVRGAPASTTNADSLTWVVTFSEAMQDIGTGSFSVTGSSASVGDVVDMGGGVYEVTVSGGDLDGVNGPVTLGFASGLADPAGNALASATPTGTNQSTYNLDNTAPAYVSATVDGATLVLTFDETLDSASKPSFESFTVGVGNGTATVIDVVIDGTGKTVTLTLAAPVAPGQSVSIAYNDPNNGGSGEPIQDAAGNDAVSIMPVLVENVTPAANHAPTLHDYISTSVATGVASALPDYRVADADNDTLTVTLTSTNGTINGLVDADNATPGIQLTGSAATINAQLADATFTATNNGTASVTITVDDHKAGSPVTKTSYLAATSPAPSIVGDIVPGAQQQTSDFTSVLTGADGNIYMAMTSSTHTLTVFKWDGSAWSETATLEASGISGGNYDSMNATVPIGVDQYGKIHALVSLSNGTGTDVAIEVATYDGTGWNSTQVETLSATGAGAFYTLSGASVTVTSNNTVNISYHRAATGNYATVSGNHEENFFVTNASGAYTAFGSDGVANAGAAAVATLQQVAGTNGHSFLVQAAADHGSLVVSDYLDGAFIGTSSLPTEQTLVGAATDANGALQVVTIGGDNALYLWQSNGGTWTSTPVPAPADATHAYVPYDQVTTDNATGRPGLVRGLDGKIYLAVYETDADSGFYGNKILTLENGQWVDGKADIEAFNDLLSPTFAVDASGNLMLVDSAATVDLPYLFGHYTDFQGSPTADPVPPTITSASYDAATHVLTVTATDLVAGSAIDVSKLSLTGEGGQVKALSAVAGVTASGSTGFSFTLNAADAEIVNQFINKNGAASTSGTAFNLAAQASWTSGADADATNAVTASNVAVPTITSAVYNATTGVVVVTGTGFLKFAGGSNDIDVSKFTFVGEDGLTRVVSTGTPAEITSSTSFTFSFGSADINAINRFINKAGTTSTGGAAYNLIANEGWNRGADPAVSIADLTGNTITATNLPVAAIASVTYDATTGVLVLNGFGFVRYAGANNDIDVGKLSIVGDGASYSLTSADVEIGTNSNITITLNAADKLALASIINKNGGTSTGGVSYSLAAADGWARGVDPALHNVDAASPITASNIVMDTTAPLLQTAVVTGTSLVLTYNEALDSHAPTAGSFTVNVGGSPVEVTNVVVDAATGKVTLTLASAVQPNQSVTVSYADASSGETPIQDAAGNDAANLVNQVVTNESGDTLAPTLTSAVVTGTSLVLTYSEALDSHAPTAGSFTVNVGGSPVAVTNVVVDAGTGKVTLTLASAVQPNQSVTVSYADASSGETPIQDAAGNDAANLVNQVVTNESGDTLAPTLSSAVVTGASLVLTYSEALDSHAPTAGSFTVNVGGSPVEVTDVVVDAGTGKVTLTLATAVQPNQSVTVSYADASSGETPIQDAAGNDAANLVNQVVTNESGDTLAPTLSSAVVTGTSLVLTYSEALDSHAPTAGSFTVNVGGSPVEVTNVVVDAGTGKVTLTLASAVQPNQSVTVSYADASSGETPIQDTAGNDAANLVSRAVTNESGDTLAPTLTSATIVGDKLVLVYDEALEDLAAPDAQAFTIKIGDTTVTVTNVDIDGANKKVTLTLDKVAQPGDIVTVSYAELTNAHAIQDGAGNIAAPLANHEVVNDSTDTLAPALQSATVTGTSLVLTYNEALDMTQHLAAGAFVVKVGNDTVTVTGAVVNNDKTVTLTLDKAVQPNEVVKVSYQAPADGGAIQDGTGNDAASLVDRAVINSSHDTLAPVLQTAVVTGTSLVLTYNESLHPAGPVLAAFTVNVGGTAVAVTNVAVNALGGTVTLTLATAVQPNQAVTVSYQNPDGGDTSSAIQDFAGNDAVDVANLAVTNQSLDTLAPKLMIGAVNGNTVVLTYIEALDTHGPDASAFTVRMGGNVVAVTNVAIDSEHGTVTLTLAQAATVNQVVTVSYQDPTDGDDANAIQDRAGNDAASFVNRELTNLTPASGGGTPPVVTPPVTTPTETTVDGVKVVSEQVRNSDGTTSTRLTIPVVTSSREEQVGNNTVADIPLAKDAAGTSILTAQLPVGYGMTSIGSGIKTAGDALTDLIREIKAHTAAGSTDQDQLTGGGSGFLGELVSSTSLVVQTIVPTLAGGTAPGEPLAITGIPSTPGNPLTAIVLDASQLPAGTHITLDNVDFAALIGAVNVSGGAGSQKVWGDSASQTIFLGAGDDTLHGGGGNDIVGSAGGNDHVYGDDGDDIVFGGEGDDYVDGGAGYDIARFSGAGRDGYRLRVQDGKLVMTDLHGSDGTDTVVDVEVLRFTGAAADTTVRGTVARLVEAAGGTADTVTVERLVDTIAKGASTAAVANGLLSANGLDKVGSAAFVEALYHNVLGRDADAGGKAAWVAALDGGSVDRAGAALMFADSAEKLAQGQTVDLDFNHSDVATLVRMYETLFARHADEGGLNFWIGLREAGNNLAQLADWFVDSGEAAAQYGALTDAQFVDTLYHTAFDRAGTAGEQKFWLDNLASGAIDRGDVLLGFAESDEMVKLVGTIGTSIETA